MLFKMISCAFSSFFLILIQGYILILERAERVVERERERETLVWERSIYWLSPIHAPTRDQTGNPGMCPHWELDPKPFGARMMLHPTEPPTRAFMCIFKMECCCEVGRASLPAAVVQRRRMVETWQKKLGSKPSNWSWDKIKIPFFSSLHGHSRWNREKTGPWSQTIENWATEG